MLPKGISMLRFLLILCAAAFLTACENIDDISGTPKPIGEFALGHNIVVAPNLVMGPASREASKEDWIASVTEAIDARFARYEGEQLYHFGVSLEGYVLAQPGVPLILSPKSALILKLTVWDDAAGGKLNEEPEQITVLENLDGDSIVGSGLTKSADEQMDALAENAAKLIQRWITRQHRQEKWFKAREEDSAEVIEESADPAEGASDVAGEDAAEEVVEESTENAVEEVEAAVEEASEELDEAATKVDETLDTAEAEVASN